MLIMAAITIAGAGCATYRGTLETPDIHGTVVEYGTRKPIPNVLVVMDRSRYSGNYMGTEEQKDELLGISYAFSNEDGSFVIPGFRRQIYNEQWMNSDYTWYSDPRIITAFSAEHGLHKKTPEQIIITKPGVPIRLFLTSKPGDARPGLATLPTFLRGPLKLSFNPKDFPQLLELLEAWYAAEQKPGGPPPPTAIRGIYNQHKTRITKYFEKEAERQAREAEAAARSAPKDSGETGVDSSAGTP